MPTIGKKVDAITGLFSERTIGMHIRRTDHTEAIRNSPIEAFTNRMNDELKLRPATKFYVATDDQDVKQALLAQYPNNVISPSWELRRDTSKGCKTRWPNCIASARHARYGAAINPPSPSMQLPCMIFPS